MLKMQLLPYTHKRWSLQSYRAQNYEDVKLSKLTTKEHANFIHTANESFKKQAVAKEQRAVHFMIWILIILCLTRYDEKEREEVAAMVKEKEEF